MIKIITTVAKGAIRLLTYGPMQNVAAIAATSPLVNYKKNSELTQKILGGESLSFLDSIKTKLVTYGNLLGLIFIPAWLFIRPKINPETGQDQSSAIGSLLRKALFILGIGGPVMSFMGGQKKLQIKRSLGDKAHIDALINSLEKKVKEPLFETLDTNNLFNKAKRSLNAYNKRKESQERRLQTAHKQNIFIHWYHGPSGSGKTSGAEEVIGRYIERRTSEDKSSPEYMPLERIVVKRLNFKTYHKIITNPELITENFDLASDLLGMLDQEAGETAKQAGQSSTMNSIAILELVLTKIDHSIAEAKEKGEDLILILDEADFAFNLEGLSGDPKQVQTVFTLIRQLFEKRKEDEYSISIDGKKYKSGKKLFFTSNASPREVFAPFKPFIKDASYESLVAENGRIMDTYIGQPDELTQSEIVANHLLDLFPKKSSYGKDLQHVFGNVDDIDMLRTNNSTNYREVLNGIRVKLAEEIYNITKSGMFLGYTGRPLGDKAIRSDLINEIDKNKLITLDEVQAALTRLSRTKDDNDDSASRDLGLAIRTMLINSIVSNLQDIDLKNIEALAPVECLNKLFLGTISESTNLYSVIKPRNSSFDFGGTECEFYLRLSGDLVNNPNLEIRFRPKVGPNGNTSLNEYDSIQLGSYKDFVSKLSKKLEHSQASTSSKKQNPGAATSQQDNQGQGGGMADLVMGFLKKVSGN